MQLHAQAASRHPEWDVFYVEGLSDHFFWRKAGPRVLTEEDCRFLIDHIGADGRVEDATELKLLLNLMRRAAGSTAEFKRFVRQAALDSILTGSVPLYGMGERRPGAIDEADVEIVRWLVYGQAGEAGLAIGREEAEFLFDLNDRTAGQANALAWTGLFVKAIAMHVLFAGDSPDRVDEAEAAWLIARIERDGQLDENERALLAYLRKEAAAPCVTLDLFCARCGV
jgi:hypothetical protein